MTENSPLTEEEVRLLTADLEGSYQATSMLPVLAYRSKVWEAAGYQTWEDYLEGEFWQLSGYTPKPGEEAEAVRFYASYGMNARAIASITSLPVEQVINQMTHSSSHIDESQFKLGPSASRVIKGMSLATMIQTHPLSFKDSLQ